MFPTKIPSTRYVTTPQVLKVRAGEWDAKSSGERLPYQEQPVTRIIGHPDYNNRTHPNDIVSIPTNNEIVIKCSQSIRIPSMAGYS